MRYYFRLVNLKGIRLASGRTQDQVADDIGVPRSTYRAWEQLRNLPRDNQIEVLADYFGCSTDDFVMKPDHGLPKGAIIPRIAETVEVPLYGSIAAGEPIEMLATDDTYPMFVEVAERYPKGFLLKVKGESMNRVIPDCSYAFINPTEDVESGRIYALNVNGHDATIKRVRRLNNGFELIPDSTDPTFEKKIYDYGKPETEQVRIIGRVVYYIMPFDFEI